MDDNRLGEFGHAKLVANSLNDMQVTELTLEGNFFTEGDVFILLSECKGSRLRELKILDERKVRDAAVRRAMHILKPDCLIFHC
jgi:hypothetical protein